MGIARVVVCGHVLDHGVLLRPLPLMQDLGGAALQPFLGDAVRVIVKAVVA